MNMQTGTGGTRYVSDDATGIVIDMVRSPIDEYPLPVLNSGETDVHMQILFSEMLTGT